MMQFSTEVATVDSQLQRNQIREVNRETTAFPGSSLHAFKSAKAARVSKVGVLYLKV